MFLGGIAVREPKMTFVCRLLFFLCSRGRRRRFLRLQNRRNQRHNCYARSAFEKGKHNRSWHCSSGNKRMHFNVLQVTKLLGVVLCGARPMASLETTQTTKAAAAILSQRSTLLTEKSKLSHSYISVRSQNADL